MDTLIKAVERFISGDWGEENCSPDSSEKVVCIRGADIENVQGGIYDSIPNRYISSSSLANKKLKIGDIVIEKSGGSPTQSTGRTCYISEDLIKEKKNVVCSNFCAAFSIRETWDYKYIYYYIQNIYNQGNFFNFEGKTSGIRNLLLDTAFKSIPLPPIDKTIQTKLSGILERIDQKISLNTRMNAELEAMAKQLYDYWFVQFDFPFDFAQGKPDENGKPYKSSGGKMVWNEKLKREIPEGWCGENICRIANILSGGTPSKKEAAYWENGTIPFFGPTDYSGSVFQISTAEKITKVGLLHCASSLFEEDTIIITARGSIGKLVVVGTPMAMNQSCYALKSKKGEYEYLYFLTRQLIECLKAKGSGSVFKSIITSDIENSILCIADELVISKFCERVNPVLSKIKENTIEVNHLTRLRDSLLPMLMNGQVTIE